MIELVFHARRPYPPVPEKYAAGASAAGAPGMTGPGGVAPESAEAARAVLTAADNTTVK
jgi:hypothetical protein